MVGRPREFDRTVALEQAMDEFWVKGYEATSIEDLLGQMHINRGSLYDTFGDKRTLFLETLQHYSDQTLSQLHGMFEAQGSPLGNIRLLFESIQQKMSKIGSHGCLIGNTAIELATHDQEIANLVAGHFQRVEGLLRRTLERADARGELHADADTRALARFLVGALNGLTALSKAGVNRAVTRDMVRVTMSTLATI